MSESLIYPKPQMKISELVKEMGFSKEWLLSIAKNAYLQSEYKVAHRTSSAPNAPYIFNTAALERIRKNNCV